ncbi:hypothetical protein LTR66_009493 [Elasticomyces elasticus]|nr:hypothetical protein LTR66_009493 [Elasticomyces elasticus]
MDGSAVYPYPPAPPPSPPPPLPPPPPPHARSRPPHSRPPSPGPKRRKRPPSNIIIIDQPRSNIIPSAPSPPRLSPMRRRPAHVDARRDSAQATPSSQRVSLDDEAKARAEVREQARQRQPDEHRCRPEQDRQRRVREEEARQARLEQSRFAAREDARASHARLERDRERREAREAEQEARTASRERSRREGDRELTRQRHRHEAAARLEAERDRQLDAEYEQMAQERRAAEIRELEQRFPRLERQWRYSRNGAYIGRAEERMRYYQARVDEEDLRYHGLGRNGDIEAPSPRRERVSWGRVTVPPVEVHQSPRFLASETLRQRGERILEMERARAAMGGLDGAMAGLRLDDDVLFGYETAYGYGDRARGDRRYWRGVEREERRRAFME